ncbi:MAG: hypothetical protein U0936_13895 [Planctomycetaceae bacterium]
MFDVSPHGGGLWPCVLSGLQPPEESTRQGKDYEPATPETTVAGTFSYMAPEQREGRTEDLCAATDVYALGLILAELLCGQRLPFITEKQNASAAVQWPPGDAGLNGQTDFGPDLTAIISKCLRPTISERYGSARELADLRGT